MASLPEDIVTDILTKLSAKSISRFRCVCKPWYELFKNPNFIKRHLDHAIQNNKFTVLIASYEDPHYRYKDAFYMIDFDVTSSSYHMVVECLPRDMYVPNILRIDSCDGLICLSSNKLNAYGKICLWNPLTRECKKIPIPTSISCKYYDDLSICGVYYDWKIEDYKLFKLATDARYGGIFSEVWVCRLGSNSWQCIGNMPYNVLSDSDICVTPLNGIIHWMKKYNKTIFSFDMVEVQTKEIQTPSCYAYDENMEVGVLGEELYLSVNAAEIMDLWVMKDYGVMDSWTKIFSLSKHETSFVFLWPMHYLNKNWEILLHGYVYVYVEGEVSGKDVLVSYNTKSGRLVTLDIPCLPKYFSPTTLVESLVSPNS